MKRIITAGAFSLILFTISCGNQTTDNGSQSTDTTTTNATTTPGSGNTNGGTGSTMDTGSAAGTGKQGMAGGNGTMNTGVSADSSRKMGSDTSMHGTNKSKSLHDTAHAHSKM